MVQKLPTIKVLIKSETGSTTPAVINVSDFDENLHERVEDKVEKIVPRGRGTNAPPTVKTGDKPKDEPPTGDKKE